MARQVPVAFRRPAAAPHRRLALSRDKPARARQRLTSRDRPAARCQRPALFRAPTATVRRRLRRLPPSLEWRPPGARCPPRSLPMMNPAPPHAVRCLPSTCGAAAERRWSRPAAQGSVRWPPAPSPRRHGRRAYPVQALVPAPRLPQPLRSPVAADRRGTEARQVRATALPTVPP